MKTFLSIIVMFSLFVVGCSEETSLNSPVDKIAVEPNWISLPSVAGMKIYADWTVTKKINGSQGGWLSNKISYTGGKTGTVTIDARIDFEQGAYPGNNKIVMTLNDLNSSTKFGPVLKFNRPVRYNVTYKGLDLTGIDPSNIGFAYLANNGLVEMALCDTIIVDLAQGKLQVVNALIPHFSRYGFVNRTF